MHLIQTASYQALEKKKEALAGTHLRELFACNENRVSELTREFDNLHYDFSKQRLDAETIDLLVNLAHEAHLKDAIERMFAGDRINQSENRRVLHVALRRSTGPFPTACDVMPEVLETRRRMGQFAEAVRSGALKGSTGEKITDVINVGIGGSDLGPKMMATALRAVSSNGPKAHFVSNLDAAQMATLLDTLRPETTLVVIVSKTFTTQETMLNAHTARRWLVEKLGEGPHLANHLAAVSSKPALAAQFGIPAERVFPIWDWVGGRYSLWSAVGLSLMLQIGETLFLRLLKAAEKMDNHFRETPFDQNLPVLMALIGYWNANLLKAPTLAILPYNDSLKFFPSFLQQLEMESNGKSVGTDNEPLTWTTAPVVWGELGNNGQHAFFQLLHQGGRLVPCDFIAAVKADYPMAGHQEALLSNCFAQTSALAFGKTENEVRASMKEEGRSDEDINALARQRSFAGNQPTSTLLLKDLSPESLAELVVLYEHKAFVQGVLWSINSFDQWGVELGKAVAKKILPKLSGTDTSMTFDASTEALLAFTKKYI